MNPKAKKSYGQHFLTDESIAERIAHALSMEGYKSVLEVGPGKGMLTKYLISLPVNFKAVEADADMVAYLRIHYPQIKPEQVLYHDFMKINLNEVYPGEQYAIIGNFPYNISSQIVFRAIEQRDKVPEVVGMFQREMAKRIIASPGSKAYGVISVLTQAFFDGSLVLDVKPESFSPPPKVQSAVIKLVRKENYQDLGCDYTWLRRVVKLAFSQRRKMLRNTMKSYLKGNDLLKEEFFTRRPEQLPLTDFIQVANWVEEEVKSKQ